MVKRQLFLALTAFAFLFLYLMLVSAILAPLAGALIWAVVLAVAAYPLYRSLRRRLGGRDTLAASLMTPLTVLLLALPAGLVLLLLVVELDALYDAIQIRILTGDQPTLQGVESWPVLANILEFLRPLTQDMQVDLKEAIKPALEGMVGSLAEKLQGMAQSVVFLALQVAVMVISLFFFFRDGEKLLERFSSLIPIAEDRKMLLRGRINEVLTAVLYGVFLTAILQGNLAFIGYWLAGLASPVLLGVVTAFASILPPLGTALVWVPAAIYLLFSGEVAKGVLLLAWGTLVVASSDNLVRPYLISGRGKVSFLAVLLGILGGLGAFGLSGMILGPIVLALFFFILDLYRPLFPEHRERIISP